MPAIIRNLPFLDRESTVDVRGQQLLVKPFQIIVWVSVVEKGIAQLHPDLPRIPAILDTGHNHNFSIQEQHLRQWAGLDPRLFPKLGTARVNEELVDKRAANIWLHPNVPNQRDQFVDRRPFCLELDDGMFVFAGRTPETPVAGPRLPLVGLRALRRSDLTVNLDCHKARITIRTPRWWIFG